jgi:hypothetical protein
MVKERKVSNKYSAEICGHCSSTDFLDKANKAYAVVRANPVLWEEEIKERKDWEQTLADGLMNDDE